MYEHLKASLIHDWNAGLYDRCLHAVFTAILAYFGTFNISTLISFLILFNVFND